MAKTIPQLEKEITELLAKLEAAEKSALGIIKERDDAQAESNRLKAELAALQPASGTLVIIDDKLTEETNRQIREKVQAGLSEAQAIEVIKSQAEEQARLDAAAAPQLAADLSDD